DLSRGRQVVVARPLVPDRGGRDDHVAQGDVGDEDAGAAAGDRGRDASSDQLLEERGGERGSDTGMDEREPRSVDRELVDRYEADLGANLVDLPAVELVDGLCDHVLEEAEDGVSGDVGRIDVLGRLDHRARRWIEL